VLAQGDTGEVYNVGGNSERTNMQVVQAICDALDKRHPEPSFGPRRQLIKHVADRPGHDRRYAIDCNKLMDETGWRPSVDFETGLQRTVDWYLENNTWVERVLDGSYQGERLGLSGAN
jgi:dTDP-glucose 4,6-dehydratase